MTIRPGVSSVPGFHCEHKASANVDVSGIRPDIDQWVSSTKLAVHVVPRNRSAHGHIRSRDTAAAGIRPLILPVTDLFSIPRLRRITLYSVMLPKTAPLSSVTY